jgi:hypothetical protein
MFFTLTKAFEGTATGLFFIIFIIYSMYVFADRSRTRATAVVLIISLAIAGRKSCIISLLLFDKFNK